MNRTQLVGTFRPFALAAGLVLAFGGVVPAQQLDPAEQTGQPFSMEGQSLMQDDTVTSGSGGPYQERQLDNIDGVDIDSDPNAPAEANSIMDNLGNNTGTLPLSQ